MIVHSKAEFADSDIWAYHALELAFVDQLTLATGAFKASGLSRLHGTTDAVSTFESAVYELIYCARLSRLLFLLCTPGLRVFFKDFEAHGAPVSTTEWTVERLLTTLIVCEAS